MMLTLNNDAEMPALGLGEAVRGSGTARDEIFVETKIWIGDHGYDETLHGFEKSPAKLDMDQIDLLILHRALPSEFARTLRAYRALETLLADGKVRAIGVSNFMSFGMPIPEA